MPGYHYLTGLTNEKLQGKRGLICCVNLVFWLKKLIKLIGKSVKLNGAKKKTALPAHGGKRPLMVPGGPPFAEATARQATYGGKRHVMGNRDALLYLHLRTDRINLQERGKRPCSDEKGCQWHLDAWITRNLLPGST